MARISQRSHKLNNTNGVIVILVLWVLVILTALAISLGKNAHIEMSLTKNAIGRLKSKYFAQAGIMYALNQIALDSQDTTSNQEDTLYYCGVKKTDHADMEKLFMKHKIGDGEFSIFYKQKDDRDSKEEIYYGFADEERRINLNALTIQNVNILVELLVLLDVEEDTAKTIAHSIIDWIDQDGNLSEMRYGAENDYYDGLSNSYRTKNRPIESMEELLLVRGVTLEVLNKMKPYVTIYPLTGNLMINFDTAPAIVLRALTRSFMEIARVSPTDADSVADTIISSRNGKDGKAFTSDDESFDDAKVSFDVSDRALYQMINQFRTKKSNYFRIYAEGKDAGSVKTRIEAVVARENFGILSWHRN